MRPTFYSCLVLFTFLDQTSSSDFLVTVKWSLDWISNLFFSKAQLDWNRSISVWCLNDRRELTESNIHHINVSKPLTVYIHGYNAFKLEESWVYQAMLEHEKFVDTNVCALNWWNITVKMPKVAANYVPLVGTYLGNMLTTVNRLGLHYKNMTLVGHSFGAHVAGVVGQKTGGQIGAIYALDPAGPFFYDAPDIPAKSNDDRLDKSDAQFVQVLHTNSIFFGTGQQIGHQDFYPNGGYGMPNCTDSFSVVNNVCDHCWVNLVFKRTLDPLYQLKGIVCDSYANFTAKNCDQGATNTFGIYSNKSVEGKFYLTI